MAPNNDPPTILLVDDDDGLRMLVDSLLEENGYRVITASNGEDAFHLFQRHPVNTIALLLTDVTMPRMSGPELAHRLRQLQPGIQVLLMSGISHEASWGFDCVAKPFAPDRLLAWVRKALRATNQ